MTTTPGLYVIGDFHMEVMEIAWKRSTKSSNKPCSRNGVHRCMRTRSSRTTEDLVELDFTTEGNGNPLGNGLGRARQPRPIGLGDAPNRHQQRQGIVPPPVRTTTLRSSWE
ncbi:unnamed protein product [Microthlaspi erraticum]|uniref:Uncharacterized protein n=1 Tax=Microthlaspi erraticum TaxID=1685480 RepID=A0A6D2JR37_9BRAS|nr:unnamed protein product [Microthlaspi erraticum]